MFRISRGITHGLILHSFVSVSTVDESISQWLSLILTLPTPNSVPERKIEYPRGL
jgi:hypothetical protein